MFSIKNIVIFVVIGYITQTVISQIIGYTPDVDYPIYNEVPAGLQFTCDNRIPGYYADPEARCQVWHWCAGGKKYSFLCPNGTVFNQYARVCDWFYNVDCPSAPNFYNVNEDLYIIPVKDNRVRRHSAHEIIALEEVTVSPVNDNRGRRHSVPQYNNNFNNNNNQELYVKPARDNRARRHSFHRY